MGAVCTCKVLGLIRKGDSIRFCKVMLSNHVDRLMLSVTNAICETGSDVRVLTIVVIGLSFGISCSDSLLAKVGSKSALNARNLNANKTRP